MGSGEGVGDADMLVVGSAVYAPDLNIGEAMRALKHAVTANADGTDS